MSENECGALDLNYAPVPALRMGCSILRGDTLVKDAVSTKCDSVPQYLGLMRHVR